ncbi:hypothetical protein ACIHCX_16770 [Streptomyces sp. NPDC052043]|uniref:hypothetical protein n=1 Tax=Streptomyces sp. NPDC052043 TaxID=3365684 RepID=UPI0037D3E9E5
MITEAAKRGEVDLLLVTVDSTTVRAHHDAAGMHLGPDAVAAVEEAADKAERTRRKGAVQKGKAGKTPQTILNGRRSDGTVHDRGVGDPPWLWHQK